MVAEIFSLNARTTELMQFFFWQDSDVKRKNSKSWTFKKNFFFFGSSIWIKDFTCNGSIDTWFYAYQNT